MFHPFLPYTNPVSNHDSEIDTWFSLIDLASDTGSLLLPSISITHSLVPRLRESLRKDGGALETIRLWERAALDATGDPDTYLQQSLGKKKLKELRRQRRRLEDEAPVQFIRHRDPKDVPEAVERFLTLEADGWKGKARSALLSNPGSTAMARSLATELPKRQAVLVDELVWGERTIASMISLKKSSSVWTWKIAYDEELSRSSPGVLLMIEATRAFMNDPDITYVDSCAVPDHPMINHIWQERQPMADLLVATRPSARLKTRAIAFALRTAHRLKARINRVKDGG
ncbi:GNAT family N-acetyltransferase [Coralliovum pocilloporae]|uniref:GNAT family N-acetyltransferase n=1 Tax=Coralliovum pocilloporae TaxID=3066369 RepID=UPI00330746EF